MTPLQAAQLWLQIAMLLHEQIKLQQTLEEQEARIEAMNRRITRLEMLINKQQPEFSAN